MKNNEEQVIIAGFGGQGVMLIGQMLSYAATNEDLNTVWIPSYGPETRGGTANCSVTISKPAINSPIVTKPDSVLALNLPSLNKFQSKIKKGGLLIVNSSLVKNQPYREDIKVIEVDANTLALQLGNLKVANMIMLGAYIGQTNVFKKEAIFKVLDKIFAGAKESLIEINQQALELGMRIASS
ncbi:MAG: 2-oxoacid:acceptor oxidoreductase family protein [Candidatus Izemoplasmataceae bacterium]|uniref:2-oxoacid:acceptor oxidoreductase family protein n=1 Tax=Liberiplasma polymorphum TaxID=3374570 RepID=UPI0037720F86